MFLIILASLGIAMSHTLVPPHHPVLNAVAETVPVDQIQTDEIQSLIDEMMAIAKGERVDVGRV